MKVGILTLPLRGNYGGVIQAYALQRFLKKNEIDAHLINRKWDLTREPGLIYKIQRFIFQNVFWRQVLSFSERMILPRTRVIRSQEEMQLIGKQDYNAFVVGSDQVWRVEFTGGVGDNYFLDFVNDPKILKISYAASFLKQLKNRHGSWDEAIKHYHSSDPKKNNPYLIKVKSFWKKAEDEKIIKAETNKIESLKKINETSVAKMIRERQPYLFERIDKVKFFRSIFKQN